MKVSIIVPDYCLAQGINSVVDQFFECKDAFLKKGIDICRVYDKRDSFGQIAKRPVIAAGTKDIVKTDIKRSRLYNSTFGQAAVVAYRFILPDYKAYRNCLKNENGEDIYLFQSVFAAWFYLRKINRKKTVFMTHMYDGLLDNLLKNYPHIKGSYFHKMLIKACNDVIEQSDCVVAICEHSRDRVKNNYNPKRITTIYNSFTNRAEQQAEKRDYSGKIRFVAASHLSYVKGMDLFMEAVELLDDNIRKQCEFHLYGDGALQTEIESKCKDDKLDNVFLYGYTPEPYRFYSDKHVFMLTSRMETLPMGIIEAMSMRLPVIATDVGAIREMINDENGILIKPTAEEICEAICYCVNNRNALETMGNKAYENYIENFSGDKWVSCFTDLFDSL